MDKLVEALKANYSSPQDALLALGLDTALVEEVSMPEPNKPKITRPGAGQFSPAALVTRGALKAYLLPRLAHDSRVGFDYDRLVVGVTSKNFTAARDAIIDRAAKATKGKLAQDADIADLANLLNALKPDAEVADQTATMPSGGAPPSSMTAPPAAPAPTDAEPSDTVAQIKAYLEQEGVSPDIINNLDAFLASQGGNGGNGGPPNGGDEECPPGQDEEMNVRGAEETKLNLDDNEEEKEAEDEIVPSEQEDLLMRGKGNGGNGASDSKFITREAMDKAIKIAQDRAVKNQKAIQQAEKFVRPWVGDLAMDANTAADVYRAALKILGVAGHDKMHADALRPVLEAQPKPAQRIAHDRQIKIAQDAKDAGSFESRWGDTTKNISIQ